MAKQFDALSRKVIGCAIEVHRFLGPGLLESSYQRCLSRELELNEIAHAREAPLPLNTKEYPWSVVTESTSWWREL